MLALPASAWTSIMQILAVRSSQKAEDIRTARAIITAAIAHPEKSVMIIRGDSQEISHFANRASGIAARFPWREVLWVQEPEIFETKFERDMFGAGEAACAVILDLNDQPAITLTEDASLFEIDRAFRTAEAR